MNLPADGVSYREIVIDVADKVGVKVDKQDEIVKIEESIAVKVIDNYKESCQKKKEINLMMYSVKV
jgi:uncharacterized protein YaaW (UPF0174 family)